MLHPVGEGVADDTDVVAFMEGEAGGSDVTASGEQDPVEVGPERIERAAVEVRRQEDGYPTALLHGH